MLVFDIFIHIKNKWNISKYPIQQSVPPTDKIAEKVTDYHHTRDHVHGAVKGISNGVYICKICDLSLRDAYDFLYNHFVNNDRYKKIPTLWLNFKYITYIWYWLN